MSLQPKWGCLCFSRNSRQQRRYCRLVRIPTFYIESTETTRQILSNNRQDFCHNLCHLGHQDWVPLTTLREEFGFPIESELTDTVFSQPVMLIFIFNQIHQQGSEGWLQIHQKTITLENNDKKWNLTATIYLKAGSLFKILLDQSFVSPGPQLAEPASNSVRFLTKELELGLRAWTPGTLLFHRFYRSVCFQRQAFMISSIFEGIHYIKLGECMLAEFVRLRCC